MAELSVYDNDPTIYLFTSLTAGSSHIVTATSRIETILRANKIPFKGVDTATDDLARKLYGRRARGKKLPLLVKEGFVVADLEQVEEWNEYDELREALGVTSSFTALPAKPAQPKSTAPSSTAAAAAAASPVASKPASSSATKTTTAPSQKENAPVQTPEQNLAIRQLGAQAAKAAAAKKPTPPKISTTNPLLTEKANSPRRSLLMSPTSALSPRSIPLPTTPNVAASLEGEIAQMDAGRPAIPKPTSQPVKLPPSMHKDAANPALEAGPTSVSQKSPTTSPPITSPSPLSPGSASGDSGVKEFHGSRVGTASEEEIRQIEQDLTIQEVESSKEDGKVESRGATVKTQE